jgi:hypothetical protein
MASDLLVTTSQTSHFRLQTLALNAYWFTTLLQSLMAAVYLERV